MAAEDYFDPYDFDDVWEVDEYPGRQPSRKRIFQCRLCKENGLTWGQLPTGYYAPFKNGKPHKPDCPVEKF